MMAGACHRTLYANYWYRFSEIAPIICVNIIKIKNFADSRNIGQIVVDLFYRFKDIDIHIKHDKVCTQV